MYKLLSIRKGRVAPGEDIGQAYPYSNCQASASCACMARIHQSPARSLTPIRFRLPLSCFELVVGLSRTKESEKVHASRGFRSAMDSKTSRGVESVQS